MKKLLLILPVLFLPLGINAQQTEDEVYIGKGKTFGNYNGKEIIIPETARDDKTSQWANNNNRHGSRLFAKRIVVTRRVLPAQLK